MARYDPKFSDWQVLANSIDPDQIADQGLLWRIPPALFGHITKNYLVSKLFGFLR